MGHILGAFKIWKSLDDENVKEHFSMLAFQHFSILAISAALIAVFS